MFDSHLESYFLRNRGRYKGILFTLHVCMQQEVVYTYGNGSVRHYWRPLFSCCDSSTEANSSPDVSVLWCLNSLDTTIVRSYASTIYGNLAKFQ